MFTTTYVFELTFDVSDSHRAAFEKWLSTGSVAWINHSSVASFEVFRNAVDRSPAIKFVFGFDSHADWATFVGSVDHQAAIDRLDAIAVNRQTVLWERASVKLDSSPDEPIGDGGHPGDPNGRSDTHMVQSQ